MALTVPADEVPWQSLQFDLLQFDLLFSLIFYHPAQVKAVTRVTAKPDPDPLYASGMKRISHFRSRIVPFVASSGRTQPRDVRFVPKADILHCGKNVAIRSPRLASPLRHYP